jgi:hypothetical protein
MVAEEVIVEDRTCSVTVGPEKWKINRRTSKTTTQLPIVYGMYMNETYKDKEREGE